MLAAPRVDDDELQMKEYQREYFDFLDDGKEQSIYINKISDMIQQQGRRLVVNINDLRKDKPSRALTLMKNSSKEIISFQRALKELVEQLDSEFGRDKDFYIGFEGSFGAKHVTPRSLSARNLNNLICVEGIVTKCSLVRPKVTKSVHYCPATKKSMERMYTDLTSLEAYPSSGAYPTKDEEGNPLETEYGKCTYQNHQTVTLQEMPEKAPAGQLPRSIDIICDNDLVDKCKPGDRIQVIGTYRCLPSKQQGFSSCTFRTIIICNNIKCMNVDDHPTLSASDISKIKRFSQQKKGNIFEALARSLAPSIHGHEYIKKAVLCLLLGGVEKILENGTRLRGDINIMLIGDPSTAKSQVLRYVLNSAPRAIATTGRGTSGVGLTAAITTDKDSGERRLEAGAMVLADRGIVCIDEFDKMSDIDRTAIHEVMEQGRVTISKAGIHAKLNARCSVLAAANPVYGRYDEYKNPMDNIGMQDSLLSRFDLLFVVLDVMDPEHDARIAEFVLRMHRYRNPGEQDGEPIRIDGDVDNLATYEDKEEEEEMELYVKHDNLLHGQKKNTQKLCSLQFLRKYIHVAKNMSPVLTREAAECISNEYAKLRTTDNLGNKSKTLPITARALETLIRLSTAHAKARMSKTVEKKDAESAVELVNFAYFKETKRKTKRRKDREEDDSDMEEDDEEDPFRFDEKDRKRPRTTTSDTAGDQETMETEETEDRSQETAAQPADPTPPVEGVSEEKLEAFRKFIHEIFSTGHNIEQVPLDKILAEVNQAGSRPDPFDEDEVMECINRMMEQNQVYLDMGTRAVFLI
ncbi:zygotic DNA replication licensing factor mcm3-like [Bolinopsis microptera]|uniref:zygotic DNA replication licensing factor mcm3-like n=1 Tax=Bolinopsis microptera TaxID=2820187 RepID=UPI00307AEC63